MLKKSWLHVSLLICFSAAIALLIVLDYFNIESIGLFNERGFYFDYTWKGRMFYLFFLWLFVLESISNWKKLSKSDSEARPKGRHRVLAILICAIIPTIYIISVNFLGLGQTILKIGDAIRGDYWKAHSIYWRLILEGDWPLSLEYLVFTVSLLSSIALAYGKRGLETFSISLALIAGISVAYMIDTIHPYGNFRPFQMLALPTAAYASVLLEILGYRFALYFLPGPESMPVMTTIDGPRRSAAIAWPCAGVQSLFLYALIILLLFRKLDIPRFRKTIFFIVGAVGTYTVNALRIVYYFIVLINDGPNTASAFHDTYGELFFVAWVLIYIFLIVCIQKFMLIEKAISGMRRLYHFQETTRIKFS